MKGPLKEKTTGDLKHHNHERLDPLTDIYNKLAYEKCNKLYEK